MTPNSDKIEIRDLQNGEWYWIQRAVIRDYVPKIGPAGIMVYNLLASMANNKQACFPSQRFMTQILDCSRTTLIKAIKILAGSGLIRVERKGHHCTYLLLETRRSNSESKWSKMQTSEVQKLDPNDNDITRINNDIDRLKIKKIGFRSLKGFRPQTREELLALDLAQELNDLPGFPLYLTLARKYPESFLREKLSEAKNLPAHQIKKSRGAFFNYLIQKNAQNFSS